MGIIPEHIDRVFEGKDPEERKRIIGAIYVEYRNEFIQWALKQHRLDESEILDIYQEATTILYEKAVAKKMDAPQVAVKTYLFGIAKKLMLRLFEKRGINMRHEEAVQEHYNFLSAEPETVAPEAKKAKQLVQQMGEPCKSILTLYYFEQLSIKSIAAALSYSNPNVVKTQKSRCLSQLRNGMKHVMKIK
jgi:RNA polymerase sigma factor (sigma-70 family)